MSDGARDAAETQATEVAPGSEPSEPSGAATARRRVNPTRLGRFVIIRPLGSGGVGTVWEAQDPELGRRVAIKLLRADRNDPKFTDGLRREAQALAKLVDPNVIAVHDVGVDDGELFIVMQLVDGESIDRWLTRRRATAAEVVAAFRDAGKGLAAAHAVGLVHRDFKPGNVLVDRDGVVRVGDFGLARMTSDRGGAATSGLAIAGTPAYMAPEQFDGVATAASDQYAFCVALYEVLAGELPFGDSSIDDPAAAQARSAPALPRGKAPARVSRALARGMSTDPAARFPSMAALLAALAPPRRRWIFAGVVALAVAATAVVTMALRGKPDERPVASTRALTEYHATACAYSPTIVGDQVVFDRTEGSAVDLYTIPLAGGAARQLTSAPTWEWRASPGRRAGEVLHVIRDPITDATQLAYLDLTTGREAVVAAAPARDAVLTASGIVYAVAVKQLRRIGPDGSDVEFAKPIGHEGFGGLGVAHGGDRVAVTMSSHETSQICIYDAATAARSCHPAHALILDRPAFGVDDRFVYYGAHDGIHRLELATDADTVLVQDVQARAGIAISSDGGVLVYSDCGARSQTLDWTTTAPAIVLEDVDAYDVTATSDTVLAWTRRSGALMSRGKDGRLRTVLEPEFGIAGDIALSPSGNFVAFRVVRQHVGLYVADLRGESGQSIALTQISGDPADHDPKWLGDDAIAYQHRSGAAATLVVHRDGSAPRTLPNQARRLVGGRAHQLLVAGDDGLYWVDDGTGAESPGPKLDVWPVDVSTSPSGNWLEYDQSGEFRQTYRMSLDGSAKVDALPPMATGKTVSGAVITDEGHLILTAQSWAGDLHVVIANPGAPF
jgi:Tol biopolymer transport system component